MAKREIVEMCMLFFLGWNISLNESLNLAVVGNKNGQWTFETGSVITLRCTIPNYTGYLKWKLNTTDVATCTPQICKQLTTGNASFTFSFDTVNFVFEWAINPVSKMYNRTVFECFHNKTDNSNFTADVYMKRTETVTDSQGPSVEEIAALAIASTATLLFVITLIALIKIYNDLSQRINSSGKGQLSLPMDSYVPTTEQEP